MRKNSFHKILIANRGEIALRIMKTCRKLGIVTVAVYSDADVNAPHTRFADESVHIGPPPVKDSYLSIDKIIEATRKTGAEAIHPGYGFLSENADFAEKCAAAGIVFIGPSPQSIRQMGLKSAARILMSQTGVPVVPGYDGEDQSLKTLRDRIIGIGFPVLIKASAGGGGKGMRLVKSEDQIDEALESARRESEKSFGNGSLLIEKYIERARHVEVQILGDSYGNIVHLFERDCSLQRRHQKIIEESPSPAVSRESRVSLGEAAVKAGRAIGYENAGTVEFILAPSGEFYFIEVNTRLQVEHPVTEMITGLDLVRLQIEIAEGKPLPFKQDELRAEGHAVEARLYAEDPREDFLPMTGKIVDWDLPEYIEGVRIDSGVELGTEVGIHYDPMLAKLIAYGPDRETALRRLSYALRRSSIQGIQTNRDFLIRLIEHPDFSRSSAHTGFIAEHLDELLNSDEEGVDRNSIIAAMLYLQNRWRDSDFLTAELPPAYRNNPYRDPSIKLMLNGNEIELSWQWLGGGKFFIKVFGSSQTAEVLSFGPGNIRLLIDETQTSYRIIDVGDRLYVHSIFGSLTIDRVVRHPARRSSSELGSANSPMPGQVLKILIDVGQKVSAGDPLIILEAMKMEHTMRASVGGEIEAVLVKQGEVVGPGQLLVKIKSADS